MTPNYRNLGYRDIEKLLDTHNKYTLGEVLYSILRLKSYDMKVMELKDINDKEMFELIEKAIKEEAEEPFTEDELNIILNG